VVAISTASTYLLSISLQGARVAPFFLAVFALVM